MILEIKIQKEGSNHSEVFRVDTRNSLHSFWVAHLDNDLHLEVKFKNNTPLPNKPVEQTACSSDLTKPDGLTEESRCKEWYS